MISKTSDIGTIHVDNHIDGNAENEEVLLEGTCFCLIFVLIDKVKPCRFSLSSDK